MSWLKVDDREDENPKVKLLDDATFRLYHRSRLYCARWRTDGWFPTAEIEAMTPLRGDDLQRAIARLLWVMPGHEHGLWEPAAEAVPGYRVHDYLKYNPPASHLASAEVGHREAGRRGGLRAAAARRARLADGVAGEVADGVAPAIAVAIAPAVANSVAKQYPVPVPVPVPGGKDHPERAAREGVPSEPAGGIDRRKKPGTSRKSGATGPGLPAEEPSSANGHVHPSQESGARPAVEELSGAELGKAIRRTLDTWIGCFEKEHGVRPTLAKGKDTMPLVRLIRTRGVDEVCELIRLFHEYGTAWSRQNTAWGVGAFVSQYDKLLVLRADGSLR